MHEGCESHVHVDGIVGLLIISALYMPCTEIRYVP
jgi:hypothetical protein